MFALFAITALPSPRHSFQAGPGDRFAAGLAGSKSSDSDSNEGLLDCSEKPQVRLVQNDLEVRCGIRISLVDEIALLASGGWNRTLSFGARDRHFGPFFEKGSFVPV